MKNNEEFEEYVRLLGQAGLEKEKKKLRIIRTVSTTVACIVFGAVLIFALNMNSRIKKMSNTNHVVHDNNVREEIEVIGESNQKTDKSAVGVNSMGAIKFIEFDGREYLLDTSVCTGAPATSYEIVGTVIVEGKEYQVALMDNNYYLLEGDNLYAMKTTEG